MTGSAPLDFNLASSHGYMLANGYTAAVRLNLQYFLWKEALGFNLHPSIPLPKNNVKIADVGSGTAIWLLDVAREQPSAQLYGFDINIAQAPPKQWLPPNVALRVWNVFDEVPEDMIGHFDVVHARLFLLVVEKSDPKAVLEKFRKLLKPGGYLQWDELDYMNSSIVAVNPSPATAVMQELRDFAYSQGKFNWTVRLAEAAMDVGFESALQYHFDSKVELARAETENILQTIDEFASRLASGGLGEESLKIRKLLEGAYQESLGGAALSVPRVVCVARKSNGSSPGNTQGSVSAPSAPYYIPEIGPRLKPAIKEVFDKWSGLSGDSLIKHLYTIVSNV